MPVTPQEDARLATVDATLPPLPPSSPPFPHPHCRRAPTLNIAPVWPYLSPPPVDQAWIHPVVLPPCSPHSPTRASQDLPLVGVYRLLWRLFLQLQRLLSPNRHPPSPTLAPRLCATLLGRPLWRSTEYMGILERPPTRRCLPADKVNNATGPLLGPLVVP